VIQSILFFALGFLCAGFLAVMVTPAIWRRALILTRRRMEASTPVSLAEIQAGKDGMRAQFAMATRRLEMSVKSLRDKTTAQTIEIERHRLEINRLAAEIVERDKVLARISDQSGGLSTELLRREEELKQITQRLAAAETLIEEREGEIEKLGRMYDEAALASSNRQIDLIARETQVDKLTGEVAEMRGQRMEGERRLKDVALEMRAAREAMAAEKKTIDDLESRVEELASTLADREEKLERREKELARLRERMKATKASRMAAQARPAAEEPAVAAMEASMDDANAEIERAVAKIKEDRDRLAARLTSLTRENRKLRGDFTAKENAELREGIGDLAAEMVALTAAKEGPDSPIGKALAAPEPAGADLRHKITSLADRVKALQKTTP
jgi:chromosome segregation ATPase